MLTVRHVHGRLRRQTDITPHRAAHDTDNATRLLFILQTQRLPHGASIRKVASRQRLTDHRHRDAIHGVRSGEHTPRANRNVEDLEVVGGDRVELRHDGRFRSHTQRVGNTHLHAGLHGERTTRRGARRGDETLGAQPVKDPFERRGRDIGLVLPGLWELDVHADPVECVKARVDLLRVPGTAQQETAPHDEDQRERDLRKHKRVHRGRPTAAVCA